MLKKRTIALCVVFGCLLVILLYMVGCKERGERTDRYVVYEKATVGPLLCFSNEIHYDVWKRRDAYYKTEDDRVLSYFYLNDVESPEMVLLNDSNTPYDYEVFLIYQSERIDDPYQVLTPSHATINFKVREDLDSEYQNKKTVLCEEKSFLSDFWQTLLETPLEEKKHVIDCIEARSLFLYANIRLYLDSSEFVYIDLDLATTESGEAVLVAKGKDRVGKSKYYYLSCTGVFRDALGDYVTFLNDELDMIPPREEPAVTTQPAMTVPCSPQY